MPIVDIEIVVKDNSSFDDGTAKKLAIAIAAVLETPPGRVWVKLRFLSAKMYAEDGDRPPALLPVFVSMLKSTLPPVERLRTEAKQLATVIADALGRPVANVHLVYESPAMGRIAFGGILQEQ
jgi:phenylpyruvate tautomerase PptA (4-oxalocrotonate tautomerase family)